MLNSIGLANVGIEAFISEKLPFLRSLDTAIVVNISGREIGEFRAVVERLEDEPGIAAYELNFSCPNVKEGGLEFSQNASVTSEAVAAIRGATQRPLIVKLTPNVTRISDVARAAGESGADIVSLINTVVGCAVDVKKRRPVIFTGTGGYSGPAIKPIALAKLLEVKSRVDIPIIGIGGITSTNDALEFMITGASAIQVGTANFIDPSTGPKIALGLEQYCVDNNLERISELVGTLVLNF
jgi:dihydroorotate dehydrogenase (NAD+) catalytic subunit